MELKQIIANYLEVAQSLDDSATKSQLKHFEESVQNNAYYLPFMGQFSAGKSRLINHLLGRDLLPTKSTETTAVLTFIQYGEQEDAIAYYEDGTTEHIDIGVIRSLDHDYLRAKESKITKINIFLPHDSLKCGLILVDTPGVNTLVDEHVRMTEELLEVSRFIIYVMGGALSESDLLMLRSIEGKKIQCAFVRTKMDLINAQEENVHQVIENCQNALQTRLNRTVRLFAIANENSCNNQDLWDANFHALSHYLTDEIGNHIREVYERTTIDRLKFIKEHLLEEIDSIESNAKKAAELTESELMKKQSAIQCSQNELNRILSQNKRSILQKGKDLLREIEDQLSHLIQEEKKTVPALLADIDAQNKEMVSVTYQNKLSYSLNQLNEYSTKTVSQYAENSTEQVDAELIKLSNELETAGLNLEFKFNMNVVEKFEEQQEILKSDFNDRREQLNALLASSEEELSSLGVEKQKLKQVIEACDDAVKEAQKTAQDLENGYEPQYITKGGNAGRMFKKVGDALDLAMLFIPATGWKAAAKFVGKGAAAINGSSRLAKLAKASLKTVQNGIKIVQKSDKIKDTGMLIKAGAEYLQTGVKPTHLPVKKGIHFLDYISLSYWFEKIGNTIDPEVQVIDEEYRRQYEQIILSAKQKSITEVQIAIAKRQELGLLDTEKKRIEFERQQNEKEKLNEQRRIEKEIEELNRRKAIELKNSLEKQFADQLGTALEEYKTILNERNSSEVLRICNSIVDTANQLVSDKLKNVNDQMSEILKARQSGTFDLSNQLEKCTKNRALLDF